VANSRLKDFYDLWVISRTFRLRGPFLSKHFDRPSSDAERSSRRSSRLA
jgi:hypothetical protein